jgi:hypothetical protein
MIANPDNQLRMKPQQFIAKWKPVALTERAAAQSHFLDLCALLGHDDPVSADPAGEWFTFEKGVVKTGGGDGFADVWKKGFFAWEYKKKKRNLDDALAQLVRYAAALENPPLQVTCDTDHFTIRTAWTNTVPRTYNLTLDDLADPRNRTSCALSSSSRRNCDRRRRALPSPRKPLTSFRQSPFACRAATRRRTSPTSSTSWCSASSPTASSCCPTASSRSC